jgi:uncharacterized protein
VRAFSRFAVLLSLLLAGASSATGGESFERGLLWKLERAGAPVSYLFGTFHTSDPQVLALPEPVTQAFDAATTVCIEVEITTRVMAELLVAMLATLDTSVKKVLPPDVFDAAVAHASHYYRHPDRIAGLKLWALISVFSVPPSKQRQAFAAEDFLDLWLEREAERRGKTVCGLETGAEQVAALDGLPVAAQIAMLKEIMQSGDPEAAFAAMRTLWLARDIGALAAGWEASLARLDPAHAAALRSSIIDDRNRRMVERMAPRLAEGNAFIAVGALHLPGENGILRLLEQQGYAVTAVY